MPIRHFIAALCLVLLTAGVATDAPTLQIVPRAGWDANPPRLRGVTRYRGRLDRSLKWIVVHHSSFVEPEGPQGLKDYHQQIYGWADLGYHFVVDEQGRVYEGRDIRYMGAHAGQTRECNRAVAGVRKGTRTGKLRDARRMDPDYGAIGVVVDGNFAAGDPPSLAQQDALWRLLDQLRQLYDVDVEHVITHREVRARIIQAQGLTPLGEPTICPGDELQSVLERYRQQSRSEAS